MRERDNHKQHVVRKVRHRQLPVMRTARQQKMPSAEFCIRYIACILKDAASTACRDESLGSFATVCAIPRKSSVLAEKVVTQLLAEICGVDQSKGFLCGSLNLCVDFSRVDALFSCVGRQGCHA